MSSKEDKYYIEKLLYENRILINTHKSFSNDLCNEGYELYDYLDIEDLKNSFINNRKVSKEIRNYYIEILNIWKNHYICINNEGYLSLEYIKDKSPNYEDVCIYKIDSTCINLYLKYSYKKPLYIFLVDFTQFE